ncbi:MAG TPA: VWA domain-containing protein, partial [Humisphaera sp.]
LFLTRSTPKLSVERKPDGPGLLKTALVQPPAPRVYLILDCSGSMMADMGGRPKFDVARQAVADLLKELPDNTQVALRAYGHRKTAIDQGADEDTELVLPMAPLDRQAFADRLRSLRPRGKTPLALSLTQAADDLGKGDGKTDVILLTDGGEDTLPRKNPAEAAEAMGRIKDVGLHVVGFDIGRADWGEQLQSIARRGKGKYWPAGNAAALTAELRAAVLRSPGGYEVRDAAERVVYRGAFGDRRELPAGRYAFVTGFAGKQYREPFWVSPGEPTAVVFDAGKVDVVQAPGATKPTTPEMLTPVANGGGAAATQPVAPRPMFCTECGAKLAPNARFCTNCGKRVP